MRSGRVWLATAVLISGLAAQAGAQDQMQAMGSAGSVWSVTRDEDDGDMKGMKM